MCYVVGVGCFVGLVCGVVVVGCVGGVVGVDGYVWILLDYLLRLRVFIINCLVVFIILMLFWYECEVEIMLISLLMGLMLLL